MNTSSEVDISETFEALSSTTAALGAYATMLSTFLFYDCRLENESWGVSRLLMNQVDDLRLLEDKLRDQVNQIKANKLAVRNPCDASGAFGVPLDKTIAIIRMVTGVDLTGNTAIETTRYSEPEYEDETLANRLKSGVDAGEIAQSLNLKQATVERVIDRLLAADKADDAPESRTAVNG